MRNTISMFGSFGPFYAADGKGGQGSAAVADKGTQEQRFPFMVDGEQKMWTMAEITAYAANLSKVASDAKAAQLAAEEAANKARQEAAAAFKIEHARYSETSDKTPTALKGLYKGVAKITLPSRTFGALEISSFEWADLKANTAAIDKFFVDHAEHLKTARQKIASLDPKKKHLRID